MKNLLISSFILKCFFLFIYTKNRQINLMFAIIIEMIEGALGGKSKSKKIRC